MSSPEDENKQDLDKLAQILPGNEVSQDEAFPVKRQRPRHLAEDDEVEETAAPHTPVKPVSKQPSPTEKPKFKVTRSPFAPRPAAKKTTPQKSMEAQGPASNERKAGSAQAGAPAPRPASPEEPVKKSPKPLKPAASASPPKKAAPKPPAKGEPAKSEPAKSEPAKKAAPLRPAARSSEAAEKPKPKAAPFRGPAEERPADQPAKKLEPAARAGGAEEEKAAPAAAEPAGKPAEDIAPARKAAAPATKVPASQATEPAQAVQRRPAAPRVGVERLDAPDDVPAAAVALSGLAAVGAITAAILLYLNYSAF